MPHRKPDENPEYSVDDAQSLFSKVFLGQMSLIVELQKRCRTSSEERDHENLASAIEGYEAIIAIAHSGSNQAFMISRDNN